MHLSPSRLSFADNNTLTVEQYQQQHTNTHIYKAETKENNVSSKCVVLRQCEFWRLLTAISNKQKTHTHKGSLRIRLKKKKKTVICCLCTHTQTSTFTGTDDREGTSAAATGARHVFYASLICFFYATLLLFIYRCFFSVDLLRLTRT
jgi:hypothetical protein